MAAILNILILFEIMYTFALVFSLHPLNGEDRVLKGAVILIFYIKYSPLQYKFCITMVKNVIIRVFKAFLI